MGGMALFVGGYLIYNAFSMTMVERTREFRLATYTRLHPRSGDLPGDGGSGYPGCARFWGWCDFRV